MSGYCDAAPGHPIHGPYHDTEYGFPLTDEAQLFDRMSLEIFQAGLSWLIILRKRPTMVRAFDGFVVDTVAAYRKRDIERLLKDEGIIRNRRKVEAIIENAKRIEALRASHGGLAKWIAKNHPLDRDAWVKLFRKTFVFMGGEVVGEFLMSVGYLPGAHRDTCPTWKKIARLNPPWMGQKKRKGGSRKK
ncbi:MAG: DNA-3-methyladenine glycosylase I [Rhodospirillales bacterium]|nr:DNA-3-methyladenine glycosylase I [Rhodospirillales bacterium]